MTRIGTWNLQGRWDDRHRVLLEQQGCDVWLLTEVPRRAAVDGWLPHTSRADIAPGRAWSAVWARSAPSGMTDPDVGTVAATVDGTTYWSSVLPWRGSGPAHWPGARHAERVIAALAGLRAARAPQVWGGDWNHALRGPELGGSAEGRRQVLQLVEELGLRVVTGELAHRLPGLLSIDHVAVTTGSDVSGCRRVVAAAGGVRVSDHDAYVVDVDLPQT